MANKTQPPIIIKEHKPWILWWVVGVHVSWALALIFNTQIRSLVILVGVDYLSRAGFNNNGLVLLFLSISSMATCGLILEGKIGRWPALMLLLPQYTIFFLSFVNDFTILLHGYVDCSSGPSTHNTACFNGQILVNRWILLALLGPLMWGALLHTASIMERYILNAKFARTTLSVNNAISD